MEAKWLKNHYMCQLLSDAWWGASAVDHGRDETTLWNRGEGGRQKNLPTPNWALSKRWDIGFIALKEPLKNKTIELDVGKNRDLGSIGRALTAVAAASSCAIALIKHPVFHCKDWWKLFHCKQIHLSTYKHAAAASDVPTAQYCRNYCIRTTPPH